LKYQSIYNLSTDQPNKKKPPLTISNELIDSVDIYLDLLRALVLSCQQQQQQQHNPEKKNLNFYYLKQKKNDQKRRAKKAKNFNLKKTQQKKN